MEAPSPHLSPGGFHAFYVHGQKARPPGTRRVMGESRRSPRGAPRCPASDKRSSRGLSRPRHNLYTGDRWSPSKPRIRRGDHRSPANTAPPCVVAAAEETENGRPLVAPTPPERKQPPSSTLPERGAVARYARASPVCYPQNRAPVGATTGRPYTPQSASNRHRPRSPKGGRSPVMPCFTRPFPSKPRTCRGDQWSPASPAENCAGAGKS